MAARPATYATAGEAAWRTAVAAAVGTRQVPDGTRFAVEVEVRLPLPGTHNDAWDLDNLIKPTLDALGGVIGWRWWNGRQQANDEPIDRIVASKRTIGTGETAGARIRIAAIPPAPASAVGSTGPHVAAHDRHRRSRSPSPVMTPYVTRRAVGWCCWRSPERLGGARQSLIVALINDEGAPYKRMIGGLSPARR